MSKMLFKYISWYLVMAMFVIGIIPRAYAGFAPSEMMGLPPADRASDIAKVQKVLEAKMVSERLKELGLTADEIQARMDQLSDQQIHQLAVKLDELQVGSGHGWAILFVAAVIAAIVVFVVYMTRR